MARRHEREAGETLTEIQSFADHFAEWLRTNWIYPACVLAAGLVIAGLVAGVRGWREHRELEAAEGLATVQREFLTAMGAQPGSFFFEEPANAETARQTRRETAERLVAFATDHAGATAAVHARIEAAALLADAENRDQALEIWRGVLASGDATPELSALVQVRIAQAEEAAGRWTEAAQAYQAAGEQRAYPLWPWALADAARALVEAGDRDQAVRIAQRLRLDAPDAELPPHLAALLDELRGAAPPQGAS